MTVQASHAPKTLTVGFTIALIGISIGIIVALGLSLIRPAVLAFAFGGLILLLPTMMVREPTAYWQCLFVLSFLVNVSKRITNWLVEVPVLFYDFGLPASGTLSIDIYVTDIILLVMLLPWFAQLCRRQRSLYFPWLGYLFVLYLAWALLVSLLEARSLYLAIFEWCRELLDFVAFIYIINNAVRRSHIRAIVLGLMVGLVVASGSVIGSFLLEVAPGNVFADVYQTRTDLFNSGQNWKGYAEQSAEVSHEQRSAIRSAGIFVHPAHAAFYLEYILPIALGYLLIAQRARNRLLFGGLCATGCLSLYLTFSRAGLIGFFAGVLVFVTLSGWSGLISRRAFRRWVFILGTLVAVASPFVIYSLWARPETITKRMELNETAVATFWQRPILGAGLNNSSASMQDAHDISTTAQGSSVKIAVVHNYYLIVLIEVGIVGFLLFFTFFGQTFIIALRHLRAAEPELKLLLAGIASGLTGVAVHNLGDPFGGHQAVAMLWLYVGLVFAICRRVQAEDPRRALRRRMPIAP